MDKFIINIIVIIFSIVFTVFMLSKLYKEYKQSETIDEKAIFWLVLIIFLTPLIIYYLDRFDIASKFNWVHNGNVDRWFDFIATYASSLISAIIGAIVLVLMTIKEINLQREKDYEDRRIQNMPLLTYSISEIKSENYHEVFLLNGSNGPTNNYNLYFKIENLGLNHARNISYTISDNKKEIYKSDLKINQSIIKKDESVCLDFIFNYYYDKNNRNNNKEIGITILYEDLLNNCYSQKIKIYLEVTNKSSSEYGGYGFYIVDSEIEKEELLVRE